MIDGSAGQSEAIGHGGREMDTAIFCVDDYISCQFVKFRPCVNTQVSQSFPRAQGLLRGHLRKANIIFLRNAKKKIAHVPFKILGVMEAFAAECPHGCGFSVHGIITCHCFQKIFQRRETLLAVCGDAVF